MDVNTRLQGGISAAFIRFMFIKSPQASDVSVENLVLKACYVPMKSEYQIGDILTQ